MTVYLTLVMAVRLTRVMAVSLTRVIVLPSSWLTLLPLDFHDGTVTPLMALILLSHDKSFS